LLVAIVLVASVTATYAAIRYTPIQNQPQILSAIDETNLALKQILGFTVGYYGSVNQVTGNSSYAQTLATNYLYSGLASLADINPEWGASFNVAKLSLGINWFMNSSYSEGNLNITYDLTGLGISGIAYLASCRLDVQISPSSSNNQVCLTVTKDQNEPLVGLSKSSFKFYLYASTNSTWGMVNPPKDPVSASNGTYIIDVPSGINPQSYFIQVKDSRGIAVAASSFSHYTGSLTFNSTIVSGGDFVDQYNSSVDSIADLGTHSNFTAQQQDPNGLYDTLTEAASGTLPQPSYPSYWNPLGSTTCVSGDTSKLVVNDGVYMTLGSYGSAPSVQTLYAHQETKLLGGTSYNSLKLASSDQSGTTLSASTQNRGRQLMGKFVYPLTGVSSIPASSGTIYYRAYKSSATPVGYCDADIVVRQSNGNLRATLISNTAASGNLGTSWATLSGAYSTSSYTVVNPTDYLEIDYYVEVTTKSNGDQMYLRVDDNGLAPNSQTRITNINLPTLYAAQAEFTGLSSASSSWNDLIWAIDSSASTSGVAATFQLYNWGTGQYPGSGNGYMTSLLGTSDSLNTQTITTNPSSFLNSTGYWKVMITTTKSTTTPFNLNLDMVQYSPDVSNYALNLEEQWTNVNSTYLNPHPVLCINTGPSEPAGLAVDAWNGGSWKTLSNSLVDGWNNISISSYLTSPDFTIRFRASTGAIQNSWHLNSALIRPGSDQDLFLSLQNPAATVAVELLQNGTMIWLGQNLTQTTQAIPIPPIPVKAIHINETIDGVNQQVPFQVEDWSSSYTVPLGLTGNTTIFSSRQMIVFLVNTHVSAFTLWWNGSDQAIQTPLAYTDIYFTSDNPSSNLLSNGQLSLQFSGSFTVTSTVVGSGTSSTASFMRINNQPSVYGSSPDWVVVNGVVRDIVQQEAEWSNGINNCPNLYANIVLTLPAHATYFTYQLSLMFINSQQNRTITDLCPIALSSSVGQLQTENGTAQGEPVVATGTQTFSNSTGIWDHHWSQFNDGTKGAGIMFTDQANQMLYTFDTMTPATARGALAANVATQTISLLPVTLASVSFQNSWDVTWFGALTTFDASTLPIYSGNGQPGLWILAELPPTITGSVGN
jgi:hypothetical protein